MPRALSLSMIAINRRTNGIICSDLHVAKNILSRMKGLLGRSSLPTGEGLWIIPCKGIHTFCMKFPIDVIFLDRDNTVVALLHDFPPNRISRIYAKVASVIELTAGTVSQASIETGDMMDFI
jgi:hypothetical protein